MYSSPKSQVCSSNQWSATAFHKFLSEAVNEGAGPFDLSGEDRQAVMMMVLEIWLDAAVPAGEG